MTGQLAKAHPHSVWLVPEPKARQSLRDVIDHLAATFDGPAFDPHITLLGDLHHAPGLTAAECQRQFKDVGPIIATVKSVERTEQHFMSLFLDVSLNADISRIRHTIFETLTGSEPPPFRPHISLAYGLPMRRNVDVQTQAFIDMLRGQRVVFRTLNTVRSAKSVPVGEWVSLSTVSLKN